MAKWYAVMTDMDDNDWGVGSFDHLEALKKVAHYREINYPESYIAVIENDVCVYEEHYTDEELNDEIRYLEEDEAE